MGRERTHVPHGLTSVKTRDQGPLEWWVSDNKDTSQFKELMFKGGSLNPPKWWFLPLPTDFDTLCSLHRQCKCTPSVLSETPVTFFFILNVRLSVPIS